MINFRKLFSKDSIGIDISHESMEVVKLQKSGGVIKLVSSGRSVFPKDLFSDGLVKQEKELIGLIKDTLRNSEPESLEKIEASVVVPDDKVYFHLFDLKKDEDIADKTKREVETNIPVSKDELKIQRRIVWETKDSKKVLVVAIESKILKAWTNIFKQSGVEVNGFDIKLQSLYRNLQKEKRDGNIGLIDVGTEFMHIGATTKNGVFYGHSISRVEKKDGSDALVPGDYLNESLVEEMRHVFNFFEKETGEKIAFAYVSSGSEKSDNLISFLKENFKIEAESLGPLVKIEHEKSSSFTGAVGVAARTFSDEWENDMIFPATHNTESK